ncbi:hypothetical protein [Psychrobacter sp.]|uniref:hypothetical protein n=1 Tax=Psychrobacter sp. TaxID=56811 RepID=UPI003F9C5CDF
MARKKRGSKKESSLERGENNEKVQDVLNDGSEAVNPTPSHTNLAKSNASTQLHEVQELLFESVEASLDKEAELVAELHKLQEQMFEALEGQHHSNAELHKLQEQMFEALEGQHHSNIVEKPGKVKVSARERVVNGLPYRVGSTIIRGAQSPKSLIAMPSALFKEYVEHIRNDVDEDPQQVDYDDLEEAEKVKKHLAYKVGNIIVSGGKSPKKVLKMPFDLLKTVYLFKQSKSS